MPTVISPRRTPARSPMFRVSRPHFELHLAPSPELPKRFGDRIRAIGGQYNECRGHTDKRFVHLPANREGRALADELLATFPAGRTWTRARAKDNQSTVIFRSFPRVGFIMSALVSTIAEADQNFRRMARERFGAGMLPRPRTAAERCAEELSRAERHVMHLRRELAAAELKLQGLQRKK